MLTTYGRDEHDDWKGYSKNIQGGLGMGPFEYEARIDIERSSSDELEIRLEG